MLGCRILRRQCSTVPSCWVFPYGLLAMLILFVQSCSDHESSLAAYLLPVQVHDLPFAAVYRWDFFEKTVAFIPTAAKPDNLNFHVQHAKKLLYKIGLADDESVGDGRPYALCQLRCSCCRSNGIEHFHPHGISDAYARRQFVNC
ncbi:hypothetical protein [Enterococcus florum]|uniref:hypothetical protein n=1 Tax=Enterococcus florum TaxID=2480627 RepID=UPI0011BAB1F5|nr:hypothetical protein [Enterococcus florum]